MKSPVTRSAAVIAAASVALVGLSACGATAGKEGKGEVVAAFYPLAWVAERVAGDHFAVVNLTRPGQEPHEMGLSARDVARVAAADLVVHEVGLQPAVDAAIENAEGKVLDVATVVELRPAADHSEEGHADEEAHGEEEEADAHDHGGLDPHFWHDPLLMASYADALAEELGRIDPDQAADFEANAAKLRADLTALDEEFRTSLATCERNLVVVNHDAFGYLSRYGLHLEPIAGLSPDAEPDAATLAELHHVIEEEGVTTVFAETLVSKKTAETLAADLGIKAGVLDPIEGLTADTADEDYLSLMRSNLAKIKDANACA